MKRLFISFLFVLFTISAFAQDTIRAPWYKRIFCCKSYVIIHDTVYIYAADTLAEGDLATEGESLDEEDFAPIDTLCTDDKYKRIILFDNGSWVYFDLPKPDLPDSISSDHWRTELVHAYYDVNVKDLPDEVDLVLCDSTHGWHIPCVGYITSTYKMRWGRQHQGIDIGIPYGEPIYAAFDGIVRTTLPTKETGGYGNLVVLRHANGLETYYAHLSHYIVNTNDIVQAGEILGYCGTSGHTSGPHLHFETRYMGQSFDPERIFDFQEGTLRDTTFTLKKHYFSIYSHQGQTDEESEVAAKQVPPKNITHTVRKGDTLSGIAKKYGTTVSKICKLNGINSKTTLRIGQKIIVQ